MFYLADLHLRSLRKVSTGKMVTLQVIAERFARMGTLVFVTDVKGDLSGLGRPAGEHPEVTRRLAAAPGMDNQASC